MSSVRWAAVAVAGFLLPLAAPQGEDFRETAVGNIEKHTGWKKDQTGDPSEEGSPFRKALKLKLKDREDHGKKKPKSIVFEVPKLKADPDGIDDETLEKIGYGPGDCEDRKRCPKAGYVVKYTAVTKFSYDGPDEVHEAKGGGKPEWPRLRVEKYEKDPVTKEWKPVLDADGNPVMVDKTEEYKAYVAAQGLAMDPPQKAWKDDPNDPTDTGLYEFGQEPQEEDVAEEITFTFPEEDQAAGEAFFRQLSAAMAAGPVGAEQAILMGFTYRGPNIDYTIGSSKRVCFFGCFYLWDIRAGFALDFGLGLRAPAYSRLSGPFDPSGVLLNGMVAGTSYDFRSVIETAPQGDWKPGDWDDVAYGVAHVDPFTSKGEGEANEFVMYFEFFAGAKVKILGINVCPWCQYVDVNIDYSTSFETPFGGGTRFPVPDVNFPIKDFNFGIVALTVGLYVTPNFTSTNIAAITNGGASVAHGASGVPETFQVAACIENEAAAPRYQTIALDEYRYNFNAFQVVIGAYLDLSVAGYGVWNPHFDFLTLDLSRALGSLGAYLPDHKNCNVAFQCTPAPASQGVSVMTQLFDQTPPSTDLALGGTPGKNGWWISDVTGTLKPTDNPRGCGAGVSSTWWGLDTPSAQGTSFQLTEERIVTVAWLSIDRDENAEGANTRVVKIDKTAPAITKAEKTTAPNGYGWYNHDVVVHFEASDAVSGLASLTPDTTLSAEAEGQHVTGTAEDEAGLTATQTVAGINIDKTKPAVAVIFPLAIVYRNTDTFQITWTATDALSGVASEGGTLNDETATQGQVVEVLLLGGGQHKVAAWAKDEADNENGDSVTFLVDVDIDGLLAAVNKVCALEWATKAGICSSLRAKVLEAKASLAAGLMTDARGQLGAFLNELDAQQDKSLLDRGYRLLRTDALWVLEHYVLPGA